jgi:hypothetical protein
LKGNKAPIENYSLGYLYWNNNSKSNASNRKKHSGWKMGDILRRLPWPWPYHGARDAINIKTSLKSTLLMDVNGIQYVKKYDFTSHRFMPWTRSATFFTQLPCEL